MEQIIDHERVKTAMQALRTRGERVSRRNVRQVLGGGGMSTIHRLMKDIEEMESFQIKVAHRNLSDTLLKTILKEMEVLVQQATAEYQEQIKQLEIREAEAIEELSSVEQHFMELQGEKTKLTREMEELQTQSAKALAVAEQKVHQLRLANSELDEGCSQLRQIIETEKIEVAKTRLQLEAAEQSAGKAENRTEQLTGEIQKLTRLNIDMEKKVAASAQKAADLREALAKAEKRIRSLEERLVYQG